MAANRTAYILETIRTGLAVDTGFDVLKVWRDTMTDNKVVTYPFVASQSHTGTYEDGTTSEGRTTVIVYANAKYESDPSGGTGNGHVMHGDITQRMETAIYNIATPITNTHTGNVWKTNISNIWLSAAGGFLDTNQGIVKAEYTIEVIWDSVKL